jgi:hypothetical protein
MKTWKLVVANAVVLALAFGIGTAVSQEKKEQPQMPPGMEQPDMATMMKKWMATTSPGPQHKWLDKFVGKWKCTSRMWMDPSMPPMESPGTAEIRWVLEGRWLLQDQKGEMIMPDAQGNMKKVPMNGMGFTGFDRFRKLYVGNWCSSVSTAMLPMSGTVDPSGKVLTMYGEMDEPMLDMVARQVKYVTRWETDDKFVFEVYDLAAGDNHKVVEVTYERQ